MPPKRPLVPPKRPLVPPKRPLLVPPEQEEAAEEAADKLVAVGEVAAGAAGNKAAEQEEAAGTAKRLANPPQLFLAFENASRYRPAQPGWGTKTGAVLVLFPNKKLGDFWMLQRSIFAIGRVFLRHM